MKKLFFVFIPLIYSNFVFAKKIALSFDDLPITGTRFLSASARLEKVFEGLGENKAIFFCNTNKTKEDLDLITRAAGSGHYIAHHGHAHKRLSNLKVNEFIADFNRAEVYLSSQKSFVRFFRFPFFDRGTVAQNKEIMKFLSSKGYKEGAVTVETADWRLNRLFLEAKAKGMEVDKDKLKAFYVEYVVEMIELYDHWSVKLVGRSPSHILLLHANDLAALYLGDLLVRLEEKGWKIVDPIKAYQDPIYKRSPNSQVREGLISRIAKRAGENIKFNLSDDESFKKELIKRGIFSKNFK